MKKMIGKYRYKHMIKVIFPVLLCLVFIMDINAQNDEIDQVLEDSISYDFTTTIAAIATHDGDKVRVRWAPDKASMWFISIRDGYELYRLEGESFTEMDDQEPKLMGTIRPYDKESWIQEAEFVRPDDPEFNIALQTIHGEWESLKLGNDLISMIAKNDELQNRFGFNLLACDFNFDAALYSGLAYVDTDNISPDKMYVYLVRPAVKDTLHYPYTQGVALADPLAPNDKPDIKIDVSEQENSVVLLWNREHYNPYYSGYWIERSVDGQNFERLNERPYIHPLSKDEETYTPYFSYSDSVVNYTPYYYRINGVTPFGETVISGEKVRAMGRDRTPPPQPRIIKAEYKSATEIYIEWEIDEAPDLGAFMVHKGYDFDKPFYPCSDVLLKSQFSFTDKYANNVNWHYYTIEAIDTSGNVTMSLPVFVQFNDTIPPHIPTGLAGACDSTGTVLLTWLPNTDPDIYGYKVMWANDSTHEFSLVTGTAITDTFFYHKVALNTSTPHVYYKIFAQDLRFNISESTDFIEIERYDIIPPLQPIFYDYKVTADSTIIYWYPSTSEDVVAQEIFRSKDRENWELLASDDNKMDKYTDDKQAESTIYYYSVVAIDKAGLRSEAPLSLVIQTPKRWVVTEGLILTATKEDGHISLSWQSELNEGKLVLYKKTNNGGLEKYRKINATEKITKDRHVISGNQYEYKARIELPDGKSTEMSKEVVIRF